MEHTLAIVKPDGTALGLMGEIIQRIQKNGLSVIAARMTQLSAFEAKGFYAVHKDKPFFGTLIDFMTSGPIFLMILEGDNAISKWRRIMGPTNPAEAPEGTIRGDFGSSIEKNVVHGSDAVETAQFETGWFFSESSRYELNPDKVAQSGTPGELKKIN